MLMLWFHYMSLYSDQDTECSNARQSQALHSLLTGPVPLAWMVTPAMLLKAGCGKVTGVGPPAAIFEIVKV